MDKNVRVAHAATGVVFGRNFIKSTEPVKPNVAMFAAAACASLFIAALALRIAGRDLFDGPIMGLLGHFTHRSAGFDLTLRAIDRFALFQGLPVFALAYASFAATASQVRRTKVVFACLATAAAAIFSRLLQLGLPHLPRPLFDASLSYPAPFGADFTTLADWSSFPSDHAALLFGVALATAAGSRVLGAVAVVLAAVASFARVYGGEHYPSDVLGGALLAAAFVSASAAAPGRIYALAAQRAVRFRAVLIGVGFIGAAEAATLFDDIRGLAVQVWAHMH